MQDLLLDSYTKVDEVSLRFFESDIHPDSRAPKGGCVSAIGKERISRRLPPPEDLWRSGRTSQILEAVANPIQKT